MVWMVGRENADWWMIVEEDRWRRWEWWKKKIGGRRRNGERKGSVVEVNNGKQ